VDGGFFYVRLQFFSTTISRPSNLCCCHYFAHFLAS